MNFARTAFAALFALAPAALQSPAPPHAEQTNRPPSVKLKSPAKVVLAGECGEGETLNRSCTPTTQSRVAVSGDASDPDGDALRYSFAATGGRLSSSGQNATLDLAGLPPGYYTVTVTADDGRGGVSSDSAQIEVVRCSCPASVFTPLPCPTVTVGCPSEPLMPGTPITFSARVTGGDPNVTPTYNWTVSAGTITGGQGTSSVTVDMTGVTNSVTAMVEVGGYDRSCSTSASCTTPPWCPIVPRKVDEYGKVSLGDEKARLHNFSTELRNDPTAQGYLVCYGGRRGRRDEARRRCERARDYVSTLFHHADARLVTVDGGFREGPSVELWLVPSGATPPQATPTVDPQEVRPPATRRKARGRGRR